MWTINRLFGLRMAEAGDGEMDGAAGGDEEFQAEIDRLMLDGSDAESEGEEDFNEGKEEPKEVEAPEVVEEVKTEPVVEEVTEPVIQEPVVPEVKVEEPEVVNQPEEDAATRKQAWLDSVEKDFAISEEDANLFINEPETIMPKLAAKVYARVMDDAQQMMQAAFANLPKMLEGIQTQTTQQQNLQTQFKELNPGIDQIPAKELGKLIDQYAPLVLKQYQNNTPEERMKALGRTIAALKGIQLGQVAPPVIKEQPVPVHIPAAPVRSGTQGNRPQPANDSEAFIDLLIDNQDD